MFIDDAKQIINEFSNFKSDAPSEKDTWKSFGNDELTCNNIPNETVTAAKIRVSRDSSYLTQINNRRARSNRPPLTPSEFANKLKVIDCKIVNGRALLFFDVDHSNVIGTTWI